MEQSIEQTTNYGYKQELKRALSLGDLFIYGLIFMVPVAPFGLYGSIVTTAHGMISLAYVVGMFGMVFTAYSYSQMSSAIPIAGSVYSYAQHGINDYVGFIAGWLILLDYILVPAFLYIGSAVAMQAILPSVPIFVWLVLFIAINTFINVRGIEMTAKTNKIILIFQIAVLAIFTVVGLIAIVQHVNGAQFTIQPFYDPDHFSIHTVMGSVSIAVLSFLGFDAISTLSEESQGGKKAVGKATIGSLLVVGILFVIQTWVAALIFPDFTAIKNPDTIFYEIASMIGGTWLKVLTIMTTVISWGIAAALVSQAAISRILYSMARDKKLPHFLVKIHPKYKTPYVSTFLVALISLIVTTIFSEQLGKLASVVNFGALSSFIIIHLAVINYFLFKKKSKQYFQHLVMPLIGMLVIGFVWWELDPLAKEMGFIWIAIGIIYLIFLKVFRKDTTISREL
ncbi:APC family permease [Sporolactobacillus nakayamae]|uniref:Amino acid/polyamine/organocation transporter, APC superfamily n=1 Tax=Sporolactobacillus nakayamae TaxID=269670 RepID=A0A1I2PRC2_9BACL|nr:APC family permease [Sporolactobacillus nakayamae]SFG16567.1 amino acid/polyamine/organocation transporter, APC superfamily [Sporolactobacillus nakayamae]